MKKKLPALVFILSLSLNLAFIVNMLASRGGPVMEDAFAELNLTDRQLKQMEPLRQTIHQKNNAIKNQIAAEQAELLKALRREPADQTTAFQCVDKISELQKKLQQNTVKEIIGIRDYMTPHQCDCLLRNLGAALETSVEPCACGCGKQPPDPHSKENAQ